MKVQRICDNYRQYGNCRFGNQCRYKHVNNIISMPIDILKIIMCDQYLSDVRQVCKKLRDNIEKCYPLQLFVFTNIMNGCYTTGCAISVARGFNDAVFQISTRALNTNISPQCRNGTWSPYDRECYSDFPIKTWEDLVNKKLTDSVFKEFYHKFNTLIYTPKYIINSVSQTERNITQFIPKKFSNDDKIMCFNIYFELINNSYNIFPLNKSIGFFNGGGS